LRQLEDRLGLVLFTRHADGMTPTPAGRVTIDQARRILAQAGQLNQALDALAGRRRIHIRLAANTVANSTFLPPALGPFLADYPEVDLDIVELGSRDIPQALLANEVDIGVMDGNLPAHGIVSLPFRRDRLVLFVPANHPLASRGNCMFREALSYPFVGMPEERALQHFVEEMAVLLGTPLSVRVRTPGFFSIAQLVEHGVGLAVLPEAAAQRHARTMAAKVVALDDPWATRELRLCVRSMEALSAQARQLVAHLAAVKPAGAT
jgi:DNA-binding transcriptional LysR family regulator